MAAEVWVSTPATLVPAKLAVSTTVANSEPPAGATGVHPVDVCQVKTFPFEGAALSIA